MQRLILVFVLVLPTTWAESRTPQQATEPAVQRFEKGDRVVFIGDSITHNGGYHRGIHLFYATRFPDRPFRVYNAGLSGDTATGTNRRFKDDIAIHEPTVATIMLGMNDAWAWLFSDRGEELPGWKIKSREKAYKTYSAEMRKLADSLAEIDCRVIFIKPSIYDETAILNQRNLIGKNVLLGRFGEQLDRLATDYGGEVVDFYTPMAQLNASLQRSDPTASIVGRDRVHPGATGHFVMLYEFLKAQGLRGVVSQIEIDASAGGVVIEDNCQIAPTSLISTDRVEFTATEQSLPYPVAANQLKALEWVPFQEEFNRQSIKVTGLKSGDYRLRIDGQLVGVYTAKEFAQGIDQSRNLATPQHKQALKVDAAESERRAVVSKLRAIAQVRHNMVRKLDPPVSEDDPVALKQALMEYIEQSREKSWYGYLERQVETYLATYPEQQELRREAERLGKRVWTINKPKPHRWVIEPAER